MLKNIVARIVSLLKNADAFTLAKTQVFMDWQERLTGLNKFRYEKWSIICSLFFFGTFAFGEGTLPLELFALSCIAWTIVLICVIERQEAEFLSNNSLDIPEVKLQWLRQQVQSTRYHTVIVGGAILLINFVVAPMKLLLLGYVVCYIASQYFTACISPRKPARYVSHFLDF